MCCSLPSQNEADKTSGTPDDQELEVPTCPANKARHAGMFSSQTSGRAVGCLGLR